jgi:hypothetical protein
MRDEISRLTFAKKPSWSENSRLYLVSGWRDKAEDSKPQ